MGEAQHADGYARGNSQVPRGGGAFSEHRGTGMSYEAQPLAHEPRPHRVSERKAIPIQVGSTRG